MELEKHLGQFAQENKEVNSLLKSKADELERVRVMNSEMELELNRLRGIENELDVTKEMAELRHGEANKLRQKCNQLEKELKNTQNSLVEAENKKKVLAQEVAQWKNRFTELDQERLRQLECKHPFTLLASRDAVHARVHQGPGARKPQAEVHPEDERAGEEHGDNVLRVR